MNPGINVLNFPNRYKLIWCNINFFQMHISNNGNIFTGVRSEVPNKLLFLPRTTAKRSAKYIPIIYITHAEQYDLRHR